MRGLLDRIRTLSVWLFAAVVLTAVPASAQTSLKVADFDGDGRSDVAVSRLQDHVNGTYRYRVDIALTGGAPSSFLVSSADARFGLHVTAIDVDGDKDLDLVISSAIDQRPIGVWINDGHGTFTKSDSAAFPESIWFDPDQVAESHLHPHAALGLPESPSQSSLVQPIAGLPAVATVARFREPVSRPRSTPDHRSNSLRAPPLS
jgi:hypothetical protein